MRLRRTLQLCQNQSPEKLVPSYRELAYGVLFSISKKGKPFEYHALSVKPFRIPLTEKCAIEKVKPLQRIISPLTHHKMAKENSKNKLKTGKINLING